MYEQLTEHEIAKELARIDLPLSTYTMWYWKIDLHNLLHFLTLRVDPHAQWEIQQYARVMAGMVKRVAPITFEAWIDYDVRGTQMSRMELDAIRKALSGKHESLADIASKLDSLSKRERDELLQKLQLNSEGSESTADSERDASFDISPAQAKSADYFADHYKAAAGGTGDHSHSAT